jgi:Xaa-Pro aminopeptidase
MKKDLNELMAQDQVDAIWVTGALFNNPDMVYFTGVRHVTQADLFKLRSQVPVLYYFSEMEREEAARSGLETRSYEQARPLDVLLEETGGDLVAALAVRVSETLKDLGLASGRIALSGRVAFDSTHALLEKVRELLPEAHFITYFRGGLIQRARMTKDEDEASSIREIGSVTTRVVARVADYLTSRPKQGETLLKENGETLCVGDIKARIRLWLAEEGVDNPEETIFSIGRDAGIPHNTGNPREVIKLGQPIIFDIFPCEAGGGYFYDITRTWCLGYAPPDVQHLYDDVMRVHQAAILNLEVGNLFRDSQELACQLFAEGGHATIMENISAVEGYVHSLGHGVGLDVHESPFCGISSTPNDRLLPGVVFTIEPGLYYPSKGMGVRIEDTIYLNPHRQFEVLAPYSYDLVLPMKTI